MVRTYLSPRKILMDPPKTPSHGFDILRMKGALLSSVDSVHVARLAI
jgi:hypothetical protein